MKSNQILKMAIATCFGAAAGSALATVTLGTASTAVNVGKEIPSTTTTLTNSGTSTALAIAMPAGAGATGTNPVYVKVALSNGAKFAGTPALSCSGLTGAATTGVTAGVVPIQNGGAGFSTVTFVITGDADGLDDTVMSSTATCVVSGHNLTISGLNNIAASATVEYTNGLVQASANTNGNYVNFVDSFSATYSASTSTVLTVDATSGSDNFVTGSNLTQATGILGYVRFDRNATTVSTATLGDDMLLGGALGNTSGSITISGPAIEAMKSAASSAGVYLSSANNCGATVVDAAFDSTATNSVTFTGLTTANITGGLYVCGIVSGSTQTITTGQITGQVGGTALTNVTINFGSAGNLQNIAQNGTTKNAYFVNASTSTNKTSVIRIVNTGGNSGTIRATAYLLSNDGTPVGTAAGTANSTIATLAANESISLSSSQLETLLSLTPASSTSKYRVVFSAGLAGFKILNYTKDVATGNLTLSQAQDD